MKWFVSVEICLCGLKSSLFFLLESNLRYLPSCSLFFILLVKTSSCGPVWYNMLYWTHELPFNCFYFILWCEYVFHLFYTILVLKRAYESLKAWSCHCQNDFMEQCACVGLKLSFMFFVISNFTQFFFLFSCSLCLLNTSR